MAASTPIVGLNSYVTLAEASAYLEDSLRGSDVWLGVDPDSQKRAILSATRIFETLLWEGAPAGLTIVDTVAIAAGGASYAVGDILTLVGGSGHAARFTVASVSAGAVTAVTLLDTGVYGTEPTGTADATTTDGAGSGCTLDTTYTAQILDWPRTGVSDSYGSAITDTDYPQALKYALIEYAFDVSQSAELLASGGTGSNVKSAGAGSARVEFFRATGGPNGVGSPRFAPHIMALLSDLLGSVTISGAQSFGTDGDSQFEDCDRNDLNRGLA